MKSCDLLWRDSVVWRELQESIAHHLREHAGSRAVLDSLAAGIADGLHALDPVMEEICHTTCPQCPDPCCLHADVRYDLRDLLFLHCRQKALPLHQPKLQPGRPCFFLGPNGCLLPRSLRPFMCTWYMCPVQREMIHNASSQDMAHILQRLQGIQQQRKDLEHEFINMAVM